VPGAPAAARDTTPSQEDEPEAQEEEEEEEALADPVPIEQLSRADLVQMEDGELASAFVWWDDVQASDLDVYRQVLDAADDEKPPQRHLASNRSCSSSTCAVGTGAGSGRKNALEVNTSQTS